MQNTGKHKNMEKSEKEKKICKIQKTKEKRYNI